MCPYKEGHPYSQRNDHCPRRNGPVRCNGGTLGSWRLQGLAGWSGTGNRMLRIAINFGVGWYISCHQVFLLSFFEARVS